MLTSLPKNYHVATIPHELGDVKIYDNGKVKIAQSSWYNYMFNKENGQFVRWGETIEDDPTFAPSCEILDMEISTICRGIPKDQNPNTPASPCFWCYKSNTSDGINMNFETFKKIIHKMPKTLTQVAYGIGDIDSNPDLWKILEYTREIGIIPNITVNGYHINDENAKKLSDVVGACAVSSYIPKDYCYNAVELLSKKYGMAQCNIHKIVHQNNYDECMDLLRDVKSDSRLEKLNAVVFLMLKKKGRGANFHKISFDKYKTIIDYALEHKIRVGFDSCSANSFLRCIKDHKDYNKIEMLVEPCESFGMFSSYISAEGIYYPCSFAEGEGDWKEGFDVVNCDDFIKDIWTSEKLIKWRNKIIEESADHLCRVCPIFDVELI
jgi:hypothetical protein